jgi:hypothetical protein
MLIEQICHAGRVDGSHQYEHGEYPGDQRPPPEQGPDGQCHEEKQEVALKPFQGNMHEEWAVLAFLTPLLSMMQMLPCNYV